MPSLCELWLPLSCAERAVDAEALCGLTTLTTLRFFPDNHEDGGIVEAGELVLDLSAQADDAHLSTSRVAP